MIRFATMLIVLLLASCALGQYTHPEDFGARTCDPNYATEELAKLNSVAFDKMLASVEGTPTYAGQQQGTIPVFLSGWYPICKEIRIKQFTVDIQGLNPSYAGSGLIWVGDSKSTDSMIHFSGSDYSRLSRIGLMGPADGMMLSAIRTSWILGESDPQRRLRFDDVIINDNAGHHRQPRDRRCFTAGIYSGGPGSTNGNDDFFEFNNIIINRCESAIRVEHPQSVQWDISNFNANSCDYMYYSDHGGSFVGSNWYPNSNIAKSIIHCAGGNHESLNIDLRGFSSEHMLADSLISATSGITGTVSSGHLLQATSKHEPRKFWLLKVETMGISRIAFRDMTLSTSILSSATGTAPVEFAVRFGQTSWSVGRPTYRIDFDNVHGAGDVLLECPRVGRGRQTEVHLDGRGVIAVDQPKEFVKIRDLVETK